MGVALAATTFVLVGCADDAPRAEVELDTTPSPSATPTQAATSDEPVDGELRRGSAAAASTPQEQAVAEAWFSFYTEMVRMYAGPDLDRGRWSEVATDQAFDSPLRYAEEQAAQGHRHTGGLVVAPTKVDVKGDEALVTGCVRTTLTEVDSAGKPVETVEPWRTSSDVLVYRGGQWRVSSFKIYTSGRCEL
ncbi:hypothetical protein GCM10007231_24030 [Nocardioides daphniae]|uniref:Nuclear transport factor 2 family protein n=1 Tax=Nocardioides daphniae TaxID=402297 RepID=A0ABQ1QEM2_9ACTN|nr:hypothetical protein GCM10007231_24030 [Nocardioides daphniae]